MLLLKMSDVSTKYKLMLKKCLFKMYRILESPRKLLKDLKLSQMLGKAHLLSKRFLVIAFVNV